MLALLGLMWNRSSVLKHTYFDYILKIMYNKLRKLKNA